MTTKLGMNAAVARGVAGSVSGAAGAIDLIQTQLMMARLTSMNPLGSMLNPGALILSPVSIGMATSAAADLTNVKNTLDYLVTLLHQEARQQEQVSNSLLQTDPGWFAQAPTARKPGEVTLFDQLWNDFGTVNTWANHLGTIESAFSTAGDIIGKWWNDQPPWAKNVAKWSTGFGKWIPFVGAPIAWADVAVNWDDDYVWGNTRNIIGASIATVELICLIPPLTPAAPIVGAVGLVWDIFDTVWDLGDEFWW